MYTKLKSKLLAQYKVVMEYYEHNSKANVLEMLEKAVEYMSEETLQSESDNMHNIINTITKARLLGLGNGINFLFYLRPRLHKDKQGLAVVGTNIVVYQTQQSIRRLPSCGIDGKPILIANPIHDRGIQADMSIPHNWKYIQIDASMFQYITSSVTIKIKNINQLDFNHRMIENIHKMTIVCNEDFNMEQLSKLIAKAKENRQKYSYEELMHE